MRLIVYANMRREGYEGRGGEGKWRGGHFFSCPFLNEKEKSKKKEKII